MLAETGFVLLAETEFLLLAETGFLLLAETGFLLLAKSGFVLLAETAFACEMDGSEFQEMCAEGLSMWMKDNGVQDCYCEVFQGEYVTYMCVHM